MSYTPGPWEIQGNGTIVSFASNLEGFSFRFPGKTIAQVAPTSNDDTILIASAPDMLEALKEGYKSLKDIINAAGNGYPYGPDELMIFNGPCNTMYNAISKAEGRRDE